ncbi:SusC/RagA family TonB-linked outer membrane protein [Filimonas effusa]|uniref:SusC/RagA family TonB-linked outer membrane protein n=1 Tax=Filimonas effusa TaxID=2508721 RepID=A0A4Q1D279_9BACT|nr:SusC/RagA family TonB-linked outer membrane protein [Filimonas effusa]RXK81181.1 SusC/RagA family TonB-linked outer membrane protein [Filimonas effusa]
MKDLVIKICLLLSVALAELPAVLHAQTAGNRSDSLVKQEPVYSIENTGWQLAFRKVKPNDLPADVAAVNVRELMNKNYMTYTLEGVEAFTPGYNGNSLWGMGSYLLLIDGVPRQADNVMPAEIEQITFLKGVNAVALYGSRAAKGVVLITTKRGEAGDSRINVRVNSGMQVPKRYPRYLGSAEYMTLYNEARQNDGLDKLYSDETIYHFASGSNPYRYPNVDYYASDYLKKMYNRSDVIAEITGGNEKAKYYTNIGYQTSGGLLNFGEAVKNNRSNRFNVRGNIDININKYITCNVDANAIFYSGKGVNADYWSSAATLRPYRFSPLLPLNLIEPDDSVSQLLVQNSNNIIDGKYLLGGTQLDQSNPFAVIYSGGHNQYTSRQFQFRTGIGADLTKVLKGLSFQANMAVDYATSYSLSYNNSFATYAPSWVNYDGSDLIGTLTKYGQDAKSGVQNASNTWYRQTIAVSGQLNYNNSFKEKHHVSAAILVNGFQQSESAVYHRVSNANLGFQADYNFRNRYYANFSAALIHSAKLPEANRRAFSPTVSLGWRLSQEQFLAHVSWIDELKLTASAGILHSDLDISDYYLYQGYYTSQGAWVGWKDGTGVQSTDSRRGDNPNMVFPKREEISIGADGTFFQRSLRINGSFFLNKITGNIVQASVLFPSYFSTGWPVSSFIPYVNYNDDKRVGFDFGMSYTKRIGAVNWTLGVNGMYYKTVATKRAEVWENDYQNRKGQPLDAIWGLQSLGFFKDQNDISSSPAQSFGQVKPGDIKYKDQNGDGIIDTRDEVFLGRGGWFGAPLNLGINFTAQWKKLTVFVLGTGGFGARGMKNNSYFWVDGEDKYSEVVRGRWTEATKNTATYPRLTTFSSDNNFRSSDFWMYKANRFDLAKVQVSYDLSSVIGQNKWMKELGVYVAGYNLLTISAERELMEMNIGAAPQTRLFNLGVKALF